MAKVQGRDGIWYDNEANARHNAREYPLDGLHQELLDYWVIKMRRIFHNDILYLHDPDLRNTTFSFSGAYRYSDDEFGKAALERDLKKFTATIERGALRGSIIKSVRIRKY